VKNLAPRRVRYLLESMRKTRVLVVGDIMLDQFIWGRVARISPEAPVPIVEFERESYMPGGAANVARNLTALQSQAQLLGLVGRDEGARRLRSLLNDNSVGSRNILVDRLRPTTIKTRIIAHQQQVVRVDRETPGYIGDNSTRKLLGLIRRELHSVQGVIIGDYGKGVVSQGLIDQLRVSCRSRGVWLSMDPKPVHELDLTGLSLITPNRAEAFQLAGELDTHRNASPLSDAKLLSVAARLLESLRPAVLLITLGDQGMLLCQRQAPPFHIPTVAKEIYDVSGAGDTVIGTFTLAVAAGASPIEAAILSNHAAGVVVGKIGTATVTPAELLASFRAEASGRRSRLTRNM